MTGGGRKSLGGKRRKTNEWRYRICLSPRLANPAMLVDGLQIKALTSGRRLYRLLAAYLKWTSTCTTHASFGSAKRAPFLSFYRNRSDSRRELVTGARCY